jgi:hypothetical protein
MEFMDDTTINYYNLYISDLKPAVNIFRNYELAEYKIP